MPFSLDIWYVLSPRLRILCWLLCMLVCLALAWWITLRPLQVAQARHTARQVELQDAVQKQWRKLHALIPSATFPQLPEPHTFTPLDFQTEGRQLVRWQPAQIGGEMVLETRWEKVAQTFSLLAERDMFIPAFSLAVDEKGLRFTLQLEHENGR